MTVCVEKMDVLVKQCIESLDRGAGNRSELYVSDLLAEVQGACEAFSNLIRLVKQHDSNQAVLVSAVKWGGKFVEQLMKVHARTVHAHSAYPHSVSVVLLSRVTRTPVIGYDLPSISFLIRLFCMWACSPWLLCLTHAVPFQYYAEQQTEPTQ